MTEPNPNDTTRMPIPDDATRRDPLPPSTPTSTSTDRGTFGAPVDAAPPPPPAASATPPPGSATPPPTDWAGTAGTAAAARVPPRRSDGFDTGRSASVLFGVIMLGIGLWFFAEQTLGLDLPRIRWSQAWPVILIVIGLWVVLGSMRRRSR